MDTEVYGLCFKSFYSSPSRPFSHSRQIYTK